MSQFNYNLTCDPILFQSSCGSSLAVISLYIFGGRDYVFGTPTESGINYLILLWGLEQCLANYWIPTEWIRIIHANANGQTDWSQMTWVLSVNLCSIPYELCHLGHHLILLFLNHLVYKGDWVPEYLSHGVVENNISHTQITWNNS